MNQIILTKDSSYSLMSGFCTLVLNFFPLSISEAQGAICGNKVTEDGEECDCGYKTDDSCKKDTCCVGRDTQSKGSGCKRRGNATCRSVNHFIV